MANSSGAYLLFCKYPVSTGDTLSWYCERVLNKPFVILGLDFDNDNIIEQATDFKYPGYRISEYKSDLEDKFQTYNKINGAIRRHFGKQMNKETKLTIHNITAKAALKFGSEAWVLKKREEQRSEAAQMKF